MSSGLSIDRRLQIIHEIYLVIIENDEVKSADTPKVDSYWLIRAIIQDRTYGINTRTLLYRVLKKSPVWQSVQPFLCNVDTSCKNKQCEHSPEKHIDGACTGRRYTGYNAVTKESVYVSCDCKSYVSRPI